MPDVPRPFVDEDGKGPLGFDRPLVKSEAEKLISDLEDSIAIERKAEDEYLRIIIRMKELNLNVEADVVEEIMQQERENKKQLENILNNVSRRIEENE